MNKTSTPPAAPLIYGRMADIMAAVTPIGKGRKNKEQGYQYRGIDDIYNEMHDLFAAARVFVTCAALELNRSVRPTAKGGTMNVVDGRFMIRFTTEDGSFVEFPVGGEAQDSGDKATNKAASAALKYAIMQTFLIPTAEVKDSEADAEEPAAPLAPPRPPVAPREEPLDLHAAPRPAPAVLPPASPAEVERCREAIATAPDPAVPFDALLERRQVSREAHATLTAALRARLAPAPEPAPEDLADRPALQPPRPARGGRTPSIF